MKRFLLVTLVAALPLSAQWRRFGHTETRPTGYVGIGFTTPTNPVANFLDEGWNIAGGVGMTHGPIGIMFDAIYTDLGIDHSVLSLAEAHSGSLKYWALTVDPVFHVNERGPVDFYVTGGGGLYSQITKFRASFDVPELGYGHYDVIRENTIYKPGVNGGVGFSFRPDRHSDIQIFIEARYHHMFTRGSGSSFVPVTIGVRF